jgi:hypothetical protein
LGRLRPPAAALDFLEADLRVISKRDCDTPSNYGRWNDNP